MPSISIAPDAIVDSTNLTGVVSSVQDLPASPDANWLSAVLVSADIDIRFSFPQSPGVPTGAQSFDLWVRKSPGTLTPVIYVWLYEAGVALAVIATGLDITSATGQLFSIPWNASLLTDPSGNSVECRIHGYAGV